MKVWALKKKKKKKKNENIFFFIMNSESAILDVIFILTVEDVPKWHWNIKLSSRNVCVMKCDSSESILCKCPVLLL